MRLLALTFAGFGLTLPAAMSLPDAALAQDAGANLDQWPQPLPASATSHRVDDAYLAMGTEMLRLNDRIAALERLIVQLVARQEENQRTIAQMTDELGRFRADAEVRMAELASVPSVVLTATETAAVPVPSEPLPPQLPVQVAPVDRFEQAMAFARKQEWPSAELAFGTFIANNPDDPRIAEARYQLGLAYLGQDQAGQAAEIFLNLFETGAASAFGADNLFALARALRALGDVDPAQVCSVYTEIDLTYGETLSSERRNELLDLRLSEACGQ